MEYEAARILFRKYCNLMDGSFSDEAAIRMVEKECTEVARELQILGFLMADEFEMEFLTERDEAGEERSVIVHHHKFILIAIENPEDEICEPVEATSKIYGPMRNQQAEK